MTATSFVEDRIAHRQHACSQCSESIGLGDIYKREAIPPWVFRYRDNEGHWVDVGEGIWIIVKRCYYCIGGDPDAVQ